MKVFWFCFLFTFAFVFHSSGQNKPENTILKWSLKREKVAESRLSPNGKFVLIISHMSSVFSFDWDSNEFWKGEVEFIETKTGNSIAKFPVCGGGRKFGLNSFSYEGDLWAVTCDTGKAELWDIRQPKLLKDFYPIKGIRIDTLVLSPDGTRLVTFENFNTLTKTIDDRVMLWDTRSGKSITELYPNLTRGSRDANTFAEFSDDSEMIAVSYNADVYLWDAKNGKQLAKLVDPNLGDLTHKSLSYTMRFSPDRTKLVTGSVDRLFKIWDTTTGELKKTLKEHDSRDRSAAFSPDGELIATADWDNYVKLWRVSTGELLWTTKLKEWAFHLKFSQDGKMLYSDDMKPTFLDVKTGKVLWSDKNWWQTDKDLKHLVTFDKKNKQLKLFEFNN